MYAHFISLALQTPKCRQKKIKKDCVRDVNMIRDYDARFLKYGNENSSLTRRQRLRVNLCY